jgi:type IV secretory pathway VirB10-like protein
VRFIDCTLETEIDSTLSGMTTCITATDTFSADGTVVLLERGTKLVGETRSEVRHGAPRIFVLWILGGTLNIPSTVTKSQGDRIQVLVARDVDFRSMYALRVANSPRSPEGNP